MNNFEKVKHLNSIYQDDTLNGKILQENETVEAKWPNDIITTEKYL